jgi:hypothetical protein
MKSKANDYLKYWKVIRYFVKSKYNLTQADLDILLFLYSEKYFSKDKFAEFNNLLTWDKERFKRLVDNGWIELFRENKNRKKALYNLSFRASRVIDSIYKKLNGEEIPVRGHSNPMFKRNAKYFDKVYRNMILEMNEFIRQQRRQPPE